ncbi:chromosomal replication initiator protein DnaA [bacterium]|nr:MAG: chromosomal replication initiator protein DnaA [bacterium]
MTIEELWQAAIGEIELSVSKANFITWIKNAKLIDKKEGHCILEVPNQFTKEWLENKCNTLILRALRNVSPEIKKVIYVVAERHPDLQIVVANRFVSEPQLGLLNNRIDENTNLNPKYSFDNFIVGSFNELAHAAALSLSDANNLGKDYNPYFVYGGVGLGKTHLIQSIGNSLVKKYNGNIKVKYVSSESFTSELVRAIQSQKMEEFKKKYRKIDVLIIDDVQFLAGKEKTQIEFFHTFNALYEANKQIVISSDRPPKAIPTLEERLCSRFEGGMTVDVSYPDLESRMAILKSKLDNFDITLPDEAINFIASKIQKNVRELEGSLNKIVAYYRTSSATPDIAKIKELIGSLIVRPPRHISPSKILDTVAEFYEVQLKDIIEGGRKKELVKPRQIAMYFLREELKESYPSIGKKLGGRDHTTVIHACNKIERTKQTDENLGMELNLIQERLYNT